MMTGCGMSLLVAVRRGLARQVDVARLGMARRGSAGQGKAGTTRLGQVGCGSVWQVDVVSQGAAGHSEARFGTAG